MKKSAFYTLSYLLVCGIFAPALVQAVDAPVLLAQRQPKAQVLTRIDVTGGRCLKGTCRSAYVFGKDGSFSYTDQAGRVKESALDSKDLQALSEQIEGTDFEQFKANNRSSEGCPSASDGQDMTYTFYNSRGKWIVSNCSTRIDNSAPPFSGLQALISRYTTGSS